MCKDVNQTLDSPSRELQPTTRGRSGAVQGEAGEILGLDSPLDESDKPLPLRSVLTKPVVVSVGNLAIFTLLDMIASAYIPLVWSTPVESGGLNLNPASIGLWLSVYGFVNCILQIAFFPHLVRRLGPRRIYISGIISCALIYVIFPFENLAQRASESAGADSPNLIVWFLITLQLLAFCLSEMGYSVLLFFCLCLFGYSRPSPSYNVYVHFLGRS